MTLSEKFGLISIIVAVISIIVAIVSIGVIIWIGFAQKKHNKEMQKMNKEINKEWIEEQFIIENRKQLREIIFNFYKNNKEDKLFLPQISSFLFCYEMFYKKYKNKKMQILIDFILLFFLSEDKKIIKYINDNPSFYINMIEKLLFFNFFKEKDELFEEEVFIFLNEFFKIDDEKLLKTLIKQENVKEMFLYLSNKIKKKKYIPLKIK